MMESDKMYRYWQPLIFEATGGMASRRKVAPKLCLPPRSQALPGTEEVGRACKAVRPQAEPGTEKKSGRADKFINR